MGRPSRSDREAVIPSSGNVFADLAIPDADERQTKVRLAVAINQVLDRRNLPQKEAALRLGVNQPKISALRKYQLRGFSVERLLRFLTALDRDIEIVIRKKPRTRRSGRVTVTAA